MDVPITNRQLTAVSRKAAEARELELEISDLEDRLKQRKALLRDILYNQLPNLMDEAQTDAIGIPPTGNLPGYNLKLSPFYKANIAASWSEEKRQQGFRALEDHNAADLIKTEIAVYVPREQREEARNIINTLQQLGFTPQTKESVNHNTLSSWLKEQYQRARPVPNLELIGGEVGRVVKITERKD